MQYCGDVIDLPSLRGLSLGSGSFMEVSVSTTILALDDAQSPQVSQRCQEYGAFLYRLGILTGEESSLVEGAADPSAALAGLARAATVTAGADGGVRYVPSRPAREQVGGQQDGAWPQAVASRQRKVFRNSPGAILQFPLERTGEDAPGTLEVFITDWSPSPAACAIAVHTAHPLSPGLHDGQAGVFTGRYCRHPLTGDLLPVWVASWVKPEFGTGVVLVNPGHDRVDLAFGREVGLPIRFALAPAGYDGSPQSWLVPPVIKTGVALRTGATDGLYFDQARAEYFKSMAAHGLAEEYTDYGAGSFHVAKLDGEGTATVSWHGGRGTIASEGSPSRVFPSRILAAADPAVRMAQLTLVAPSKSVETDVLALRLLLAEPGLGESGGMVPEVITVGGVTGKTDGASEAVLRLSLLVGGGALETLSVKPQALESSERFLAVDAELGSRLPDAEAEPAAGMAKAAAQVKELLASQHDAKQAFTQLYRLQKSLSKAPAVCASDLLAYRALAYVLAGTGHGDPAELAAAWRAL